MRAQHLITRPWVLSAVIGVVTVGLVETVAGVGPAGFAVAVLGALIGVILLPIATQLGMLAGAVLFGLRVRHVVFGAMRRIGSWTLPARSGGRVTVTLRALPVVLGSEIGPWRPPVILRCWLAGVVSALTGLAVVTAGWLLADGSFGRGFVVAVTPLMVYKLWPRREPMATSTGWLLFGLPRMPEPKRTEFRAGPMVSAAQDALRSGNLDTAQAKTDELTATYPDLSATTSCQVTMLEARGEYAQAVALLAGHIASTDIPAREMSYTLAGMAGLGFAAVEAAQVPSEDLVPMAKQALADAVRLGYPEFQLSGTKGLLALLEGDPDEAARLAVIGAEYNTSPLSQADDFATLARAHMARQDNAAARTALENAERLAAWWPRVQDTRARLSIS